MLRFWNSVQQIYLPTSKVQCVITTTLQYGSLVMQTFIFKSKPYRDILQTSDVYCDVAIFRRSIGGLAIYLQCDTGVTYT